MRSKVLCSSPKCDTQIGWLYTCYWGDRDCDPPETKLFNDEFIDGFSGDAYCEECWNAMHEEETPEP